MTLSHLHWFVEVVLLTALAVALWKLRQQRTQPRTAGDRDPEAGSDTYIAIRILNPMELARRQSWLAGTLAGISPNFVRRLVHTRTVQILKDQLLDYGVQADVRLERGRPAPGLPLKDMRPPGVSRGPDEPS